MRSTTRWCSFPQIAFFFLMIRRPPRSPLFPSTTLFRSHRLYAPPPAHDRPRRAAHADDREGDRVGDHRADVRLAQRESEEHTSELQSQSNLVCRLLLEKKNRIVSSSGPVIPPS